MGENRLMDSRQMQYAHQQQQQYYQQHAQYSDQQQKNRTDQLQYSANIQRSSDLQQAHQHYLQGNYNLTLPPLSLHHQQMLQKQQFHQHQPNVRRMPNGLFSPVHDGEGGSSLQHGDASSCSPTAHMARQHKRLRVSAANEKPRGRALGGRNGVFTGDSGSAEDGDRADGRGGANVNRVGAWLQQDAAGVGGLWRQDEQGPLSGGSFAGNLRGEISGGGIAGPGDLRVIGGLGGTGGAAGGGEGSTEVARMAREVGPLTGREHQQSLQTLATVAAAAGKRKLRRGPDGKFEAKTNILARSGGRFANPYGITQADLTESMIRPLMRFCQDTAAEALKVSKNTLSKACKRLNLTWPHRPQVPTTDRQKASMRNKSRSNRIPRNSVPFLYCEKEEGTVVRFQEVRLSADSCTVYQRWGRKHKKVYRANKKTRHANKEEAMIMCHSLRSSLLDSNNGWQDKVAPALPRVHNKQGKSKKTLGRQKLASMKEAMQAAQTLVCKMKAANKLDCKAHSEKEIQEAVHKLEEERDKLHKARRLAQGLPQKTREQRLKVKQMKQANRTAPNTHSKEEVASEVAKLRLLMSKWNKRALVPPSKSQKAHQSEEALENDPIGCRAEPADPLLQLRRAVLAQEKTLKGLYAASGMKRGADGLFGVGRGVNVSSGNVDRHAGMQREEEVMGVAGGGGEDGEGNAEGGLERVEDGGGRGGAEEGGFGNGKTGIVQGGGQDKKIEVCERNLKLLRSKLEKARRKIVLEDLRKKVNEMKAANKDGTGCYTKGMISAAMTRVRQLMSKDWRQAMPPDTDKNTARKNAALMREFKREVRRREKEKARAEHRAAVLKAKQDAKKLAESQRNMKSFQHGARPSLLFESGWRRCNCPKDACKCGAATAASAAMQMMAPMVPMVPMASYMSPFALAFPVPSSAWWAARQGQGQQGQLPGSQADMGKQGSDQPSNIKDVDDLQKMVTQNVDKDSEQQEHTSKTHSGMPAHTSAHPHDAHERLATEKRTTTANLRQSETETATVEGEMQVEAGAPTQTQNTILEGRGCKDGEAEGETQQTNTNKRARLDPSAPMVMFSSPYSMAYSYGYPTPFAVPAPGAYAAWTSPCSNHLKAKDPNPRKAKEAKASKAWGGKNYVGEPTMDRNRGRAGSSFLMEPPPPPPPPPLFLQESLGVPFTFDPNASASLKAMLHPPPNKDIQGASCQVGGFRVYDSSLTPAGVTQGVYCHSALEGGAAAAAGGGTAAAEGAGGESGAGGGAGKGPEILAQPEAQTESESASAGTVAESARGMERSVPAGEVEASETVAPVGAGR